MECTALYWIGGITASILVLLFWFLWKRISQNENRINQLGEIVQKLQNSVQHRLTSVETNLTWIVKTLGEQSDVLIKIKESCDRKENL